MCGSIFSEQQEEPMGCIWHGQICGGDIRFNLLLVGWPSASPETILHQEKTKDTPIATEQDDRHEQAKHTPVKGGSIRSTTKQASILIQGK
jgi:hypothetical protein